MERGPDEGFFLRALEAAGVGAWEWEVAEDRVRWSSTSVPFYGRPASELPETFAAYREFLHPDDREAVWARIVDILRGPSSEFAVEHRVLWPDGTVRWLEARGTVGRDGTGRATRVSGVVADVTDRVETRAQVERANRALRTRSECNRILVDAKSEDTLLGEVCGAIVRHGYRMAWIGFGESDAESTVRVVAHAGFDEGYLEHARIAWHAGDVRGQGPTGTAIRQGSIESCRDFLTDPRVGPWREDAIRRGYRSSIVIPFRVETDGHWALTVYASEPGAFDADERALLADLAADVGYGLASLRNRAERLRAVQSLQASEALLRQFIEHTPAAVAMFDREMRFLRFSRHWVVDFHLEDESLAGRSLYEVLPDIPERWKAMHRRALEGWVQGVDEDRLVRGDGATEYLQWEARPWFEADESIGGIIVLADFVTGKKLAERELELQRRRASAVIDSAMDGIITLDPSHRIVVFNRAAEAIFRCTQAEVLGQTIDRFIPERFRSGHGEHIREFSESGQTARGLGRFGAVTGLRSDGTEFPMEASISYFDVDDQRLLTVTCRDVSERARAEKALREADERFRDLTDNIREVVWIRDLRDLSDIWVNPAFEEIWGRSRESLIADPDSWWDGVHPEDRERLGMKHTSRRGLVDTDEEYRIVRPDGTVRWVHSRVFPVKDDKGNVFRVAGVVEDITERRRVEEQLRQSQKMEAVGQLAGGVAHDFNNILAAILMQAQIGMRRRNDPATVDTMLKEIERSAERGAELTKQLLQFSRQQILHLRNVEIGEVVRGFAPLLSRVLPEHVHLELRLDRQPRHVRADVGMLEQVLMNLALNARDAMPRGGQLVLSTGEAALAEGDARVTAELPPGKYVSLQVADDGTGIPADVLPHIFEPFFTTKQAGRGTGLGLATVFGIVQQHRGGILVTSDEGKGSRFEVLLPAQELVGAQRPAETNPSGARGGHETLLLAEDDDVLRRLWVTALEDAGYEVIEAENGVEAWKLFEARTKRIDLLVTDIVMPRGVSGRDLAVMIQQADPNVRVVFLSGYSPDLAGRDLRLGPRQGFLAKPFSMHQLLDEVRACLDEGKGAPDA